MADRETYTIHIDGRWSLEDLYVFPRAYEQVYFAVEALLPALDAQENDRILRAFSAFPWHGGYSAVGFYNSLKLATQKERRPEVISIRYASPGWIEIGSITAFAFAVAHIVNRVTSTIDRCNRTYSQIYKDAQDRELLGIEIERKRLALSKEQIEFALDSSERLARMMDLPDPAIVHSRTDDPVKSMKILLSLYRRIRTLATYQVRGKARFSNSRD